MIVVDANVVTYFFVNGEKTALARALHGRDDWVLPSLWRHEFLNVLATLVRNGYAKMHDAQATFGESVKLLQPGERDADMALALQLAGARKVNAYDAQYIVLARELNTVCISEDRALQRLFPDVVCGMRSYLERRTDV